MRMQLYKWIGPEWRIFSKGVATYNLDTITDEMIDRLLQEEPEYWKEKFAKKQTKKKEKTLVKASEEPPVVEDDDCGCK